jgi:hypothetical protein
MSCVPTIIRFSRLLDLAKHPASNAKTKIASERSRHPPNLQTQPDDFLGVIFSRFYMSQ